MLGMWWELQGYKTDEQYDGEMRHDDNGLKMAQDVTPYSQLADIWLIIN